MFLCTITNTHKEMEENYKNSPCSKMGKFFIPNEFLLDFEPIEHKYTLKCGFKKLNFTSASSLINEYFPEFPEIARRKHLSKVKERFQFLKDNGGIQKWDLKTSDYPEGIWPKKLHCFYDPFDANPERFKCPTKFNLKDIEEGYPRAGTEMHARIENFLKFGIPMNLQKKEDRMFMKYFESTKTRFAFIRSEFRFCLPRYGWCGTADALVLLPDGRIGILDWKLSSKLYPNPFDDEDLKYARKCSAPFNFIKACARNRYHNQLHYYEMMGTYGNKMTVGLKLIVVVNLELDEIFEINVPLNKDLPKQYQDAFKLQAKEHRLATLNMYNLYLKEKIAIQVYLHFLDKIQDIVHTQTEKEFNNNYSFFLDKIIQFLR